MLETILGLFSSSAFGAITGLIGSYLTKIEERKNLELKYNFDLKMADIRLKETTIENTHQIAIADKQMEKSKIEGEIKIEEGELASFKDSINIGNQNTGNTIIDGIRSLMRPLITTYLLIVSSILTVLVWNLVDGLDSLPKEELISILQHVIYSVMSLTSMAVCWWYGARSSSKYVK